MLNAWTRGSSTTCVATNQTGSSFRRMTSHEALDHLPARDLRQRDRQLHDMPIGLDLWSCLIHHELCLAQDDVHIDSLVLDLMIGSSSGPPQAPTSLFVEIPRSA
jgi:hypothetical protein